MTHRRIGDQAGLSHGVVSYHFRTRDELIYRSFEYHLGSVEDYGSRVGLKDNESLTIKNVIQVLTRLVAEELANPKSIRIDLELMLYGTRRHEIAALFNSWIQKGVDALTKGLAEEGYEQPQTIAWALTDLTRGFLLDCLTMPSLSVDDFRRRAEILIVHWDGSKRHGSERTATPVSAV